ncbi:MAG: hypothetical protein K1X65_14080 [Caldilineales bacterium]|nr:hypothetical protein [Caldilineales bacterium]
MRSRRLEIFAFTAMLFAMLALFVSLQSNTRADDGSAGPDSAAAPQQAQADIPHTFNYQGFLRNPDGTPMSGVYKIDLAVYSDVFGGSPLSPSPWSWFNVPVQDGLFNVVVEDTGSVFTANAPLYIGIKVNNGPELIPRQRVHPVPWAQTLAPNATVSNLNLTGSTLLGYTLVSSNANGLLTLVNQGGFEFQTQSISRLRVNTNGDTIVYGSLKVNNDSPVLIKRWNGFQCTSNEPCLIPTGINSSTHYCTMAGWELAMDISENDSGVYSRWLYTDGNGQWILKFSNNIQDSPQKVWAEIVCYRAGIYAQTFVTASGASDGTDPTQGQAPEPVAAPADDGQ